MDVSETPDYRRAEANRSAVAMAQRVITAMSPNADPEEVAKLTRGRYFLDTPESTVHFAAFAGAWGIGRVARDVADQIADEVTAEVFAERAA